MVSLRAEATYGSNAPLSALSALIAKRCEVLNETAKDAAIATMIDALKSVRAATAQARPGAKTKPQIALRGELVPSFTREGASPLHTQPAGPAPHARHPRAVDLPRRSPSPARVRGSPAARTR